MSKLLASNIQLIQKHEASNDLINLPHPNAWRARPKPEHQKFTGEHAIALPLARSARVYPTRPRVWRWLDYEQGSKVHPVVASLEMSIATAGVLWDGSDGVTFPLGKVAKCMQNGSEDSPEFFAEVILDGPSAADTRAEKK